MYHFDLGHFLSRLHVTQKLGNSTPPQNHLSLVQYLTKKERSLQIVKTDSFKVGDSQVQLVSG